MGLDIALMDCNGKIVDTIGDPKNFLHRLLPSADEESDSLLSKIDWYGGTYFNYLQMRRFLAEWEELAMRTQTPEERVLVASIRSLAIRCQSDRSILKFIGD
jgi:hypothetical protein